MIFEGVFRYTMLGVGIILVCLGEMLGFGLIVCAVAEEYLGE